MKIDNQKEPIADFKSLIETRHLKGLVTALTGLVDECKVKVSSEGFEIKVVDAAHIAMMEVFVGAEQMFSEFKVRQEGHIGIDLNKMHELLKSVGKTKYIKMETFVKVYPEKEEEYRYQNRLKFIYDEYIETMCMVDTTGMSDPKVLNLELPVEFEMMFSKIQEIVYRLGEKLSDFITIRVSPGGITFISENDFHLRSAKFPKELMVNYNWGKISERDTENYLKVDGYLRSLFPLDYFKCPFWKSGKKGWTPFFKKPGLASVRFKIGQDHPIIMEAGSREEGLMLKYLLAPRIESE